MEGELTITNESFWELQGVDTNGYPGTIKWFLLKSEDCLLSSQMLADDSLQWCLINAALSE